MFLVLIRGVNKTESIFSFIQLFSRWERRQKKYAHKYMQCWIMLDMMEKNMK